ncbi:FKBP-type peptidyl-prolyl cis-trans isomerase [Hoylesella shahii]|jgi:peptidyl-prolyl cis-trans isomerase|uniref:peptidylprolyl isomerase n=1 Tax=Hoylesella shahii DSM 15611 = JCM 12083 TaxID=1122991 RepID=A0A318I8T9_9BACT|nr:FKBP-type peptidyl-prolyl cis-trans isomerase [Hoylesella shahii]PXX23897.1 FKBP-type peptidyl-prolyl cis-trans isomerase FklB [Hoylesella shahii DSM 15611 = JCM 12083]
MKKTTYLALALLASATFNTALAGKKKDAVQVATPAPVELKTTSDSMSYAAGMAATKGLMTFVQQQYKVDTTYMADFIRGFRKALDNQTDAAFAAYVAGIQIAQMAQQRILPSMQHEFEGTKDSISAKNFYIGFVDALQKNFTKYTEDEAQQLIEKRIEAAQKAKVEAQISTGRNWLAENAKKPGVVTLPSGLQYKVITNGAGEKPTATDEVVVKYEGKLIDGTIFDSSYSRTPDISQFQVNRVIAGWTEAMQLMTPGSKWELYIPQNLAYGANQMGSIPPYSTLIFTVELIKVVKAKPETTTDANETKVAKPAKKATRPAAKKRK